MAVHFTTQKKVVRSAQRAEKKAERAGKQNAKHWKARTARGASAPGEYPRKRTGHARRDVGYEFDDKELRGRIGAIGNVTYLKFLELGTRRMQRRPWLSRGVRECIPLMKKILTAPVT